MSHTLQPVEVERQTMDVDIACAGFGPATGGFLTTLAQAWSQNPSDPVFESRVASGMPLQIVCYERADDLAAGVSGVVTRGEGIRASFPALDPAQIPMAAQVKQERILYLLDPIGASRRRSRTLRVADLLLYLGKRQWVKDNAFELPWTPAFLHKQGGLVLSIGQFNQWVASQLMATGFIQIWPGTPVAAPIFSGVANAEHRGVSGVRLADQGVDKLGAPAGGFMPGMDVRAQLTVVGDGPVGAIGQRLDERFGLPQGHAHREWALGMKFVIELPEDATLEPGTVWHTFGFPEPEIFGFLYVHPERLVSVGIFVPSWLGDPQRTAYRYLQHYIQHPALWRHLKDGTLRSWGAKSLEESGLHGEPFLSGDGFARIGEGSGSTNMLTGSGVDEAWTTGVQLAEAVLEILRAGLPFSQENLAKTYEKRRRASAVERGAHQAQNARNGFHKRIRPRPRGHGARRTHRRPPLTACAHSARAQSDSLHPSRQPSGARLARSRRARPPIRPPAARRAHVRARLAGDSLRRPSPRHPTGCAADGRQSAGHARLRRSRRLSRPSALHLLHRKNLHLHVLRSGHHARPRGRARLRARKMRALRRMPLELPPLPRRRARQH